jgi:5'-nucleotidase
MKQVIDGYWEELSKKLDQPAGYTAVELDARFEQIRCKETNISNFVADVIRFAYKTDVVLLNSGSLRADEVISTGIFRWKEVDTLFPIQDS